MTAGALGKLYFAQRVAFGIQEPHEGLIRRSEQVLVCSHRVHHTIVVGDSRELKFLDIAELGEVTNSKAEELVVGLLLEEERIAVTALVERDGDIITYTTGVLVFVIQLRIGVLQSFASPTEHYFRLGGRRSVVVNLQRSCTTFHIVGSSSKVAEVDMTLCQTTCTDYVCTTFNTCHVQINRIACIVIEEVFNLEELRSSTVSQKNILAIKVTTTGELLVKVSITLAGNNGEVVNNSLRPVSTRLRRSREYYFVLSAQAHELHDKLARVGSLDDTFVSRGKLVGSTSRREFNRNNRSGR